MATETKSPKITYATMTADRMEDLHRELDAAIERVKARFGKSHPMVIGGRDVKGTSEFDDRSPIDTRILLGRFQAGSREQVRDAIAAAKAAFPAWSARPWRERVALVKKIADGIRARRWELAALMGYEAGKNRLECVGDVEESADLIEYYCDQVEKHDGFQVKLGTLGPGEDNSSVLRPYGVYHSMYDDHLWVSKFGDPGFRYHAAMTRLWGLMALRLANADIVPLEYSPYAVRIGQFVDELAGRTAPGDRDAMVRLRAAADRFAAAAAEADRAVQRSLGDADLDAARAQMLSRALMQGERALTDRDGIPGRPWYRHLIYAPQPTYAPASGQTYAPAWGQAYAPAWGQTYTSAWGQNYAAPPGPGFPAPPATSYAPPAPVYPGPGWGNRPTRGTGGLY